MRPQWTLGLAAGLMATMIVVRVGAETQGARGGGPPQAPPQGGNPTATFPAQQRPLAPPEVVARGKALFELTCRACHGADMRGGDMGGPNLLRSALVLGDQDGELIGPVVISGRQNPGMPVMPPQPLSPDDVKAVAAYIHFVAATMRGQGNPPASATPVVLNILVGDATAGQAYFQAKCTACHSITGDLAGIATRISDPMALQNAWVAGGGGGRGRGAAPGTPNRREVTVTVTPQGGAPVKGRLVRVDDFIVILADAEGLQRSFRRDGDIPKVEINDPLEGHRKLLSEYTDKAMHDVTAYLVTVK
jgi:cytochrome c oxidase cbb3-type subunit III